MPSEIERKFLVVALPDLSRLRPVQYERYYLERTPSKEVRIQAVNDAFEMETKQQISDLERTTEKKIISKDEFARLKRDASESILRDSYFIHDQPKTTIKVYHGRFEGLVRAEIEFVSSFEAKKYTPESWMGPEITDTSLGRDSKLIDLSPEEFSTALEKSTKTGQSRFERRLLP